ncbi:MAG: hypothetical protein LUC45_02340 [Paraprevotella sp.]|nr:hypothetical protein [Paraprevotella sp.]
MKSLHFGLSLLCLTLTVTSVRAQELPTDPIVRRGTLSNGLTYYIATMPSPPTWLTFILPSA